MAQAPGALPEIAFFPEASFGAALKCVGIAQELQKQRAVPEFICHPGSTGVFAEFEFKEYHLPEGPADTAQRAAAVGVGRRIDRAD